MWHDWRKIHEEAALAAPGAGHRRGDDSRTTGSASCSSGCCPTTTLAGRSERLTLPGLGKGFEAWGQHHTLSREGGGKGRSLLEFSWGHSGGHKNQ